jgi:hypothetical protein
MCLFCEGKTKTVNSKVPVFLKITQWIPEQTWNPLNLLFNKYHGLSIWGQRSRSVKLTTHLLLMRRFNKNPRCHWTFQLTYSFQPHYALESIQPLTGMSTRNLSGVKGRRPAIKMPSLPSLSRLPRKCRRLDISQASGPTRPVAGIALSF